MSSPSATARKPRRTYSPRRPLTPAEQQQLRLRNKMAAVLDETVAELGDNFVCRQSLAFAGFTDEAISATLDAARHAARRRRALEISHRYASQFEPPHVR